MMTGHDRDPEPNGRYELLHKPFDGERLLAAVRACLDRPRPLPG
jgi:DNA-binding response OmpR family regulator